MRRHAPASARNRDPILSVLRQHLPPAGRVLEIASGSGEHAVHFAAALPTVEWQPSDPDPDARASIAAWIDESTLPNVRPPLDLDTRSPSWDVGPVDAVVCINMIHVAPWDAAVGLFRGAARILRPGALLYLYGPFAVEGRHTAPSNAAFDESLRARNPEWGVRDLSGIESEASRYGLRLEAPIAMPANNLSLILRLSPTS